MTLARRYLRASRCVLPALLVPVGTEAQVRADAPIAPAATIGPVTGDATLSLLGMASLPDGSGSGMAQRSDVWLGATQPMGRIGRVRLTAIGSGTWRMRDGVHAGGEADGQLSVRGRLRIGEHRVWSAVTYGYGAFNGAPSADVVIDTDGAPSATRLLFGAMQGGVDTTVARRVDIGRFGRAEAGIVSRYAGLEFAVGVSVEQATRVTTQTLHIASPAAMNTTPGGVAASAITSGGLNAADSPPTLRTRVSRQSATGMASVGFETGATSWLVSITSPLANAVHGDALAPRPRSVPTVASVAVVRPVTEWLSVMGAAATNTATVGTGTMRDDVRDGVRETRRADFAPVMAVGVRLSRLPWRSVEGTPDGILAFETRTLGTVDALSLEQSSAASEPAAPTDTLRVVLLIDAPRAESVELMGDATAWTVTAMRRLPSGRWRAELKLPPGMHRLIVRADGGKWTAPPGVPIGSDEYGGPVGMIHVRARR